MLFTPKVCQSCKHVDPAGVSVLVLEALFIHGEMKYSLHVLSLQTVKNSHDVMERKPVVQLHTAVQGERAECVYSCLLSKAVTPSIRLSTRHSIPLGSQVG